MSLSKFLNYYMSIRKYEYKLNVFLATSLKKSEESQLLPLLKRQVFSF